MDALARDGMVPRPGIGVAGVVVAGDRVLLVLRGRPPAAGLWAFPGGRLERGERLEAALRRELREECDLAIEILGRLELVELIEPDASAPGGPYHWVVVAYLARPAAWREGAELPEPRAGDDALEVRWVALDRLDALPTVPGLPALAARARVLLSAGPAPGPEARPASRGS